MIYQIITISLLLSPHAFAADKPDATLHSSIRVKGVHSTKDWPESKFSDNSYWNQVLREDPHPLDKACIEKQIQEIQKLFIPQPGQNFSQALKNQQINSGVEIQLQYGMDLNNGPAATLVQTYRFKALEWDMFKQRSLRVNVTLPHAKSGNANRAATCVITSAELMAKAI